MAKIGAKRGRKLSIERLEQRLALSAAPQLMPGDVNILLERAAAASSRNDAIIAVVDRNGSILGVKVESGVNVSLAGQPVTPTNQLNALVFAIDGAVAEARTAALFSSDQAPLSSRTIRDISQTTITQREVQSNPNFNDLTSPYDGPGLVAPVGLGGEFPAGIMNTPQVDLFGIELNNRDSAPTTTGNRFNVPTVNLAFTDASLMQRINLVAPQSYGQVSQLLATAQSRGIATLPGGEPIYELDSTGTPKLVGGIGVFFPGPYGYATWEQGFTQLPSNASASAEAARETNEVNAPMVDMAEWMAFAAAGGTRFVAPAQPQLKSALFPVGSLAGIAPIPGIGLILGQINLAGITLEIYGPNGTFLGTQELRHEQSIAGVGIPSSNLSLGAFNPLNTMALDSLSYYAAGKPVPSGWLVVPHTTVDAGPAAVAAAYQIVAQGVTQANITRAQIRLGPNPSQITTNVEMVFAISDTEGNLVALFRMPDAPVFSIDVAVAKARNDVYYDSSNLAAADMVTNFAGGPPVVPSGTAFTSRTFRFLSEPRYPIGTSNTPPGPFSALNDLGINPLTGDNTGAALPASVYSSDSSSVDAFAAFNPTRNFRDPHNLDNQNGVVFFPGSSPLYINGTLTLGLGVSGDGVDQDDTVTAGAQVGYAPAPSIRADQYFVRNVRLPFQKYDRNPNGL